MTDSRIEIKTEGGLFLKLMLRNEYTHDAGFLFSVSSLPKKYLWGRKESEVRKRSRLTLKAAGNTKWQIHYEDAFNENN